MRLGNQRGEVILGTVAIVLLILLGAIFIPNGASKAIGIQNKENKIVQSTVEKVDLIKDKDGNVIATKTTTAVDDRDIQQHITFWEWFTSLPVLIIVLCVLGFIFPPVALFFGWLWRNAKIGIKQIVTGIEEAKKTMTTESTTNLETNLSKKMDTGIKSEVKKIKVGL